MNYLAHLYLSGRQKTDIIGAILGDFVKGRLDHRYPPSIQLAIMRHRKIDSYADRHNINAAARNLISAYRRRFAGIILDVVYDHFLANHWSEYSAENLDAFIRMIYNSLKQHQDLLPSRLKQILPHMVLEDWLGSCRQLVGVDKTLQRIARRLKKPDPLHSAIFEIENNYQELEQMFLRFFPQLVDYVETLKTAE